MTDKLQPIKGVPGGFRTSGGDVIRVREFFPRFVSITTPWKGRPEPDAEWAVVDVRTTGEDLSGTVRIIDEDRNKVIWEADKRVLVARNLAQREIMPEMIDAASYLGAVAEAMREGTSEADVFDLEAMSNALEGVTKAWHEAYATIERLHSVPSLLFRGDLPRNYKITCDDQSIELHLVVLERRPVT